MLKEFVEKLLSLSEVRTCNIGEITYTKDNLLRIKPPEHNPPAPIKLHTLSGLIDYIPRVDYAQEKLILVINSPIQVFLMAEINPENENRQFCFAVSELAMQDFAFGHWFDLEQFVIELLGKFEETTDRNGILEIISNLANEHVIDVKDDKFTQRLQVKTGLVTKANINVKNPVSLQPYRTFREVDQPESNFILRYRNQKGGNGIEAALFEGDGSRWQLNAIENIRQWLVDALVEEKLEIPVIG